MAQHPDGSTQAAMNLAELLIRVGNDRDLVWELIVIFKKKSPLLMSQLKESVALGDTNRVETTSHALTGMLSCIAATRAAALAGQLEQMGREGRTLGLSDALTPFEHEVAKLLPELDGFNLEAKL